MIVGQAFGGEVSTQAGVGLMVIVSTTGICMAYYNINRLQIEQHRAWMLKTFFYVCVSLHPPTNPYYFHSTTPLQMGSIITLRFILAIATQIISAQHNYYLSKSCSEILYLLGQKKTNTNTLPTMSHPSRN
jgi:uncharacterized membrane protein YozB (DUF420 family)